MKASSALLIFVFFFSFAPLSAQAYAFYRDLKLGDSGEDVRMLQQTLNASPETRIAATGVGSPGQETTYFGPMTQAAVIRFQELNAQDILMPLGLFAGTGYVGAATRAALGGSTFSSVAVSGSQSRSLTDVLAAFNTAVSGIASGASALTTGFYVAPPNPMALARGVVITSMTPTRGGPGTKVTLIGSGFASTNDIQTNFFAIEGIPSSDGTTITFTMDSLFPDDFDFPEVFEENVESFFTPVLVENENGHSNPLTFELLFD